MAEEVDFRIEPVKLEDFFGLQYRTGSVRDKLTGQRMHMVSAAWWESLNELLLRELRENCAPAIHLIGYTLGSALVEGLKDEIGDNEALVNNFTDFAAAAGWGVITVAGDLRHGKNLVASVVNCPFCEKVSLGQSPQCTLMASALEGMADKIFGTAHRARETRCSAMGEALCHFVVEESPLSSSVSLNSAAMASPDWESLWASPIPAILLSSGRD